MFDYTVFLDVKATFYYKIAFIRLDFPTFDLPTNNTSFGFFNSSQSFYNYSIKNDLSLDGTISYSLACNYESNLRLRNILP